MFVFGCQKYVSLFPSQSAQLYSRIVINVARGVRKSMINSTAVKTPTRLYGSIHVLTRVWGLYFYLGQSAYRSKACTTSQCSGSLPSRLRAVQPADSPITCAHTLLCLWAYGFIFFGASAHSGFCLGWWAPLGMRSCRSDSHPIAATAGVRFVDTHPVHLVRTT